MVGRDTPPGGRSQESAGTASSRTSPTPACLAVAHDAGFFSNCTVLLEAILEFARSHGRTPARLDTTGMFLWYRAASDPAGADARAHFFLPDSLTLSEAIVCAPGTASLMRAGSRVHVQQFSDYADINYGTTSAFVHKYFSPTPDILARARALEEKYGIDPERTCVLFHRGNDKGTEARLPDYDDYAALARAEIAENPDTRFLLQSDESEFLAVFGAFIPGAVVFGDEIRHMPRCASTVDKVFAESNHEMIKNFLAITLVMARCRAVVCGSGNCAMWVALYRGHARGVRQIQACMLDVVPEWILRETGGLAASHTVSGSPQGGR